MNGNWYELAIIGFILAGIAWISFRGGAANPVGTGKLGRQVSGLSGTLSEFGGRLLHVEGKIDDLEKEAATTDDVRQLEKLVEEKIKTLSARMDGHHELSKATNRGVERIERLLMEKGIGR